MGFEGIGRRQAEIRKRLGLSQRAMADRLGVPMRTLADNERGISVPGGRILAAYAKLGISPDWLLTGEGSPLRQNAQVTAQGLEEVDLEARVAIAFFSPRDLRDTYRVDAVERHRRAILALARERVQPMIAIRDLGLPDACRLVATEMADNSMQPEIPKGTLLLFDAAVTTVDGDGLYLLIRDDLLIPRRLQALTDGQVAVFLGPGLGRVDACVRERDLLLRGRVVGRLLTSR